MELRFQLLLSQGCYNPKTVSSLLFYNYQSYQYYFSSDEARLAFMTMRNRLTYIAAACLVWAALVILFVQA